MSTFVTPRSAHLSAAARSAAAQPVLALLDGGYLSLFSGRRPHDVDETLDGQRLLVELRFDSPAFGSPDGGVALARPLLAGRAVETGRASFFRCYSADHASAVIGGWIARDGDPDDADDDDEQARLFLNETNIRAGAAVLIRSFAYAQAG